MSKKDLPPVPPAGRSNKGRGEADPGDKFHLSNNAGEARQRNLDQQGRQGNIKVNTTHQGYQQDRRHMPSSQKTPEADRSHGGPGSSQQDATKPATSRGAGPLPGQPTNSRHSRVSGGGGERDSHHTHNLPEKGKGKR